MSIRTSLYPGGAMRRAVQPRALAWRLLAGLLMLACLPSATPQASDYYTRKYPYGFIHTMGGFSPHGWTPDLLQYLGRFGTVWVGNEYELPSTWVDDLDSSGTKLLFYEFFPAVHFLMGKDNATTSETWKVDFLDNHKFDFYTINPLIAPSYTEFTLGRHFPDLPYAYDYFINYGLQDAEDYLINQYRYVKRANWGYHGIFFDLMGSYWMDIAEIQNPSNTSLWNSALDQYNWISATRDTPANSYDKNGADFLVELRAGVANPSVNFPIWGNQAYLSGNPTTHANEYYRAIDVDLMESTFTSWVNPGGSPTDVDVRIDGVWHYDVDPVETKIMPFLTAVNELAPLINQSVYAWTNYSRAVNGVVLNYVRPLYVPISGGYEATVDREAIYYGYATGAVTGLLSYGWDFFDTVSNGRSAATGPIDTGLPLMSYFKWAKDDIYFLELGNYADTGYEVVDLGSGGKAVLRFFDKGFVIINASTTPQNITVNLSAHAKLKGSGAGVNQYYNHFTNTYTSVATKTFSVPAAYRPFEGVYTNSARVFSYIDSSGDLL